MFSRQNERNFLPFHELVETKIKSKMFIIVPLSTYLVAIQFNKRLPTSYFYDILFANIKGCKTINAGVCFSITIL